MAIDAAMVLKDLEAFEAYKVVMDKAIALKVNEAQIGLDNLKHETGEEPSDYYMHVFYQNLLWSTLFSTNFEIEPRVMPELIKVENRKPVYRYLCAPTELKPLNDGRVVFLHEGANVGAMVRETHLTYIVTMFTISDAIEFSQVTMSKEQYIQDNVDDYGITSLPIDKAIAMGAVANPW